MSVIHYDMKMVQKIPSPATSAPAQRNANAAQRFVVAQKAVGQVGFTMAQITKDTGLSTIAARAQLKRLNRPNRLGGCVVRVSPRQDFFLIVGDDQLIMGAPPVFWWLDAYFQTLGRPYYVALLSAASEYGSSHQAVQTVQVITDKPQKALEIGRLRVQFFVKKRVAATPAASLPQAYAPLQISTPEATALDLLRYAHRIGGVGRAVQAIKDMLPHMSKKGMRQALEAETELSTMQRFGFVLEALGQAAFSQMVAERLPARLNPAFLAHHAGGAATTKAAHALAGEALTALPMAARWSLFINADVKELS